MNQRDDFSQKVREILARRVGTLCSNPQCSVPTYGPNENPEKSTSKGVAAHITAAAAGGPRYDPEMTPTSRCAIENGIWLCESCAKMIDADEAGYTVDVLRNWKEKAETRARKALENPRIVNCGPDFADTLLFVTRQHSSFGLTLSGGYKRLPISLRPIQAKRNLLDISVPLVFKPNLLPEGTSLIYATCQNQGTGVDQFVKIDIRFQASAVLSTQVDNPTQVQPLGGGGPTSSYASFVIPHLLPGECQGIKIIAKSSVPFSAGLWSQNSGQSPEVFIYDLIFGEPEEVS